MDKRIVKSSLTNTQPGLRPVFNYMTTISAVTFLFLVHLSVAIHLVPDYIYTNFFITLCNILFHCLVGSMPPSEESLHAC